MPGSRQILVALVGKAGQALCEYYRKVGRETELQTGQDIWPGIPTLTPDIIECDRVIVERVEKVPEHLLYDSRTGCDPFDFQFGPGRRYVGNKPIGPRGSGTYSIKEGCVVDIERDNKDGTYEIWLRKYVHDGADPTLIPKDEQGAGDRKIRVSCEAKVLGGEHTLSFKLKDPENLVHKYVEERRITSTTWTPIDDIYFHCTRLADFRLRIADQEVSQVPSSVRIRNLVVAERLEQ